jgi:hypothetical protein
LTEVPDTEHDLTHALVGQKFQLMEKKRFSSHLDHGFRDIPNPIPKPRSQSAGKDADRCGSLAT